MSWLWEDPSQPGQTDPQDERVMMKGRGTVGVAHGECAMTRSARLYVTSVARGWEDVEMTVAMCAEMCTCRLVDVCMDMYIRIGIGMCVGVYIEICV